MWSREEEALVGQLAPPLLAALVVTIATLLALVAARAPLRTRLTPDFDPDVLVLPGLVGLTLVVLAGLGLILVVRP